MILSLSCASEHRIHTLRGGVISVYKTSLVTPKALHDNKAAEYSERLPSLDDCGWDTVFLSESP